MTFEISLRSVIWLKHKLNKYTNLEKQLAPNTLKPDDYVTLLKERYKRREDVEEVSWMTLRKARRYRKLKEEALDRTLWRTRFGKVCGPVVGQTMWR
jgi:hypothetical protein